MDSHDLGELVEVEIDHEDPVAELALDRFEAPVPDPALVDRAVQMWRHATSGSSGSATAPASAASAARLPVNAPSS